MSSKLYTSLRQIISSQRIFHYCNNYNVKRLNSSTSCNHWDYDIIVIGYGIPGASFVANLCKLSKNSLKICVVDSNSVPIKYNDILESRPIPDIRTYALSPQSINYLNSIDVWDLIQSRSQSYKSMQIWETFGPGLVRFNANEFDMKYLGSIVEDSTVLSAIHEKLNEISVQTLDTINFKFKSVVSGISTDSSGGPITVKIKSISDNSTCILSAR